MNGCMRSCYVCHVVVRVANLLCVLRVLSCMSQMVRASAYCAV